MLTAIVFGFSDLFSLALEHRADSIANGPHPAFGHLLPRGEGMMQPLYEITTPKSGMSQTLFSKQLRQTIHTRFDELLI